MQDSIGLRNDVCHGTTANIGLLTMNLVKVSYMIDIGLLGKNVVKTIVASQYSPVQQTN